MDCDICQAELPEDHQFECPKCGTRYCPHDHQQCQHQCGEDLRDELECWREMDGA